MASFSAIKPFNFSFILFILFSSLVTLHVSCFQYEVGGKRGWIKPDGSEFETYNEWAEQNRFHIGDTINFKYTNDSVLLVERDAYEDCDVHNPILKFNDGNTVFEFDNSGFVYFISGKTSHCQAGQKMIIRVMVQSAAHHPTASTPAPSVEGPSGGRDGGDGMITDSWGPSATNSSDMLSVTSCFLTMFMGVVVVLYLFMD
ncbi:early nodulin-like protein 21 [Beta vulgaris subsp. vulgaris]|uniref:early nodulin-like protein 21 n=1 Tax=Beta vulgaris subsp. vulgaris TaxID=3555 RepID=UPI002037621F|nr:early nodulin-like protein 21 [Beta vulgaris subsp. vulgaris]